MLPIIWALPSISLYDNCLDPVDIPLIAIHKGNLEADACSEHDDQILAWNRKQDRVAAQIHATLKIPPRPTQPTESSWEAEYTPPAATIEERCGTCDLVIDKKTGIPFSLRHAFLEWLNLTLEATYYAAAEKAGRPVSQNIDLWEWNKLITRGEIDLRAAYNSDHSPNRTAIRCGAEHVRHDFVHRRDISVTHLSNAMKLPALLGDLGRQQQVNGVFGLLCVASEPDADETTIERFQNAVAMPPFAFDRWKTPLLRAMQLLIEKALFHHTEKHSPEMLNARGWTVPGQGEMPEWEELYRRGPNDKAFLASTVVQDSYPDADGTLLSWCIRGARQLRNDAVHRHEERNLEEILGHLHNSIMSLNLLGDHEAAVEAEILVEQWVTKASRAEVLHRLGKTYLDEDLESIWDPLLRRRESRRRNVLTNILRTASLTADTESFHAASDTLLKHPTTEELPPMTTTKTTPPLDESLASQPSQIPISITVTSPDYWDFRRQTFYSSMHPCLMVLPASYEEELWSKARHEQEQQWQSWVEAEADGEDLERMDDSSPEVAELSEAFEAEMQIVDTNEASGMRSTVGGVLNCTVEEDQWKFPLSRDKRDGRSEDDNCEEEGVQGQGFDDAEVISDDDSQTSWGTESTYTEGTISDDDDRTSWESATTYGDEATLDGYAQSGWNIEDSVNEWKIPEDLSPSCEKATLESTWADETSNLDVEW